MLTKYRRNTLDQRGITGLETAIILIAFVVVASVFAFTVLSTGIFSSERGKETIYAGLSEARGTIEPKGGVIANGLTKDVLSNADAVWTAGSASTTVSLETTDKKEGTGSAEMLVASTMTTGLLARYNLASPVDLTDQTQVSFWIKSTTTTASGDIELVLDETAGCGSPDAQIDVEALVADTWTLVTAAITNNGTALVNSAKNAIACVGLEVETDWETAITVNADEIVASGMVASLIVNITNAVEGEAVTLTEPSDANDDGIADADSNHVMVITYTDKDQLVRDVYWVQEFLGENDGDDLLETGERAEITIYLDGLADATPLVKDKDFSLEIKPAKGAVLNIQRTVPAVVDTVMNLN